VFIHIYVYIYIYIHIYIYTHRKANMERKTVETNKEIVCNICTKIRELRNVGEYLYKRKPKLETPAGKNSGLKRRAYHFPYIAIDRLYIT